jgi:hypothetical protein
VKPLAAGLKDCAVAVVGDPVQTHLETNCWHKSRLACESFPTAPDGGNANSLIPLLEVADDLILAGSCGADLIYGFEAR